jgi:hypothetical protein
MAPWLVGAVRDVVGRRHRPGEGTGRGLHELDVGLPGELGNARDGQLDAQGAVALALREHRAADGLDAVHKVLGRPRLDVHHNVALRVRSHRGAQAGHARQRHASLALAHRVHEVEAHLRLDALALALGAQDRLDLGERLRRDLVLPGLLAGRGQRREEKDESESGQWLHHEPPGKRVGSSLMLRFGQTLLVRRAVFKENAVEAV